MFMFMCDEHLCVSITFMFMGDEHLCVSIKFMFMFMFMVYVTNIYV